MESNRNIKISQAKDNGGLKMRKKLLEAKVDFQWM